MTTYSTISIDLDLYVDKTYEVFWNKESFDQRSTRLIGTRL